jgi:membrane protease subunit HflC
MRKLFYILVAIVILIVARMSFYSVDATEYVYVTQLGKRVATFDGGDKDGAGLHVGWPWPVQANTRLDRRLQAFDLPSTEFLTHDPEGKTIDKTLTVEASVFWRIVNADAVDRFIRRMGTAERARDILGQRVTSQLGAALGQMKMDDLINTEPGKEPGKTHVDDTLEALKARLLSRLQKDLDKDYGIALVDIRLRRFNHPVDVRKEIFERIRSERQKKVSYYESEGKKQASNITSAAVEKERGLLAKARYEAEKLKGEADTEAIRIRNQAHSQDPEFYAFLKKLEKLQSILGDNKTVLLLSSHRPLFDLLFQPPRPNSANNGSPSNSPSVPAPITPRKGGEK